jgi:hypothetical protein
MVRPVNRRSPFLQFLIFVGVLILINVVLALIGSPLRISIIGSIVLSVIVGGIMAMTNRR